MKSSKKTYNDKMLKNTVILNKGHFRPNVKNVEPYNILDVSVDFFVIF